MTLSLASEESGSADAGAVQEVRCSSCAFDVLRCGSLAESNSTRAERDYHIRSVNEREEDGGSQPPSTQIRAFSAVLCSMGSGTATTHSNHACTDSLRWRVGIPLTVCSSKNLSSHPHT
ncbi:hypothetical protein LdCL_080011100 [Leishmania donovani]|uniref:Uncharacterized protein n=1 Tax=Leishmania donovani TaxID=5661 RepID=A0A3S5H660_LEIDO|nr:hypothetical protein LdCL_080011100 [Leishmania donovani]